jgi:hypothetical protein
MKIFKRSNIQSFLINKDQLKELSSKTFNNKKRQNGTLIIFCNVKVVFETRKFMSGKPPRA